MPLAEFERWLRWLTANMRPTGPTPREWVLILGQLARVEPAPQVLVSFDFRGFPRLTPFVDVEAA